MLDLSVAFATFPALETERFLLRDATAEDAQDMFRVMGDPRVARYLGHPPMASLDEAAERVAGLHAAFQEQSGVRWVIAGRADGRLIGTCGFWRLVKPHFRAEVGYELAPEWWGRGAMAEALAAVLGFGFGPMGLHSVEAQIDPDNTGSRRVLEKLGFVQEGYLRESYYEPARGRFTDTAIFSLLKSGWLGAARPS